MSKAQFEQAKVRASKEVLTLLEDGFLRLFEVDFPEQETAYIKLRHTSNGNFLKIRVVGGSWEVWKNGKLVSKNFV